MAEKVTKTYEVINCECGHDCPIEFAHINDDGQWICGNCQVEYMDEFIRALKAMPEEAIRSLCQKGALWIDCEEGYENCDKCPFRIKINTDEQK